MAENRHKSRTRTHTPVPPVPDEVQDMAAAMLPMPGSRDVPNEGDRTETSHRHSETARKAVEERKIPKGTPPSR